MAILGVMANVSSEPCRLKSIYITWSAVNFAKFFTQKNIKRLLLKLANIYVFFYKLFYLVINIIFTLN